MGGMDLPSQYRYGRQAEERVARQLRGLGASVELSPGSRGPADLVASFPTGTGWAVQVKASRGCEPAAPARQELANLKRSATATGRTAVVANVTPEGIEFRSARNNRRLTPPGGK